MTNPKTAATIATWHDILRDRQFDRLPGIIRPDAIFRSPAFYKPYPGREAMVHILTTVISVFEDFEYIGEFWSETGTGTVLEFSARVGDKRLRGVDIITFDEDGRIAEFEVMVRPANGLLALGEEMSRRAGPRLKELLDAV